MEEYNSQDAFQKLSEYNISDDNKNYLKTVLIDNNPNTKIFCYTLKVVEDAIIIKQVIGKGGHYFKLTTQNFNLQFIWYNNFENKIEFWGYDENNIIKAKDIIEMRFALVKQRKHITESNS